MNKNVKKTYHLAVDIGASSGRHILGWTEDGILKTKEIYRFENGLKRCGDVLAWDIENLEFQVKTGIKKCADEGIFPATVAIDTWGVDYVLLDKDKQIISPVYCYRDSRTEKAIDEVYSIISKDTLYQITGIQEQAFNTIFQLYCDKKSGRLDNAEYFMMMPAYLSYCLTGKIENEFTEASTSGMLDAKTGGWSKDIIDSLGLPERLFKPLMMPGQRLGSFSNEFKAYAGFDADVVFCASHDTGSAVAACPLEKNGLYISSGTWSLIGMELYNPVLKTEADKAGFSNEGGVNRTTRFLKNYMGMWLLQNIRRNINKEKTYDEMMYLAQESGEYEYFDVHAQCLVAPENMIDAIRGLLKKPDMPLGVVINSVYHSLAKSYKQAVENIEKLTGEEVAAIHIVGGGCQDKYLDRLTSEYTGKTVTAGPVEATAIGNLIAQIMSVNPGYTIEDARELVRLSFAIQEV